ncbi:MAG: FtsH protease activity modulator HflK [Planctomycetota bacterium]
MNRWTPAMIRRAAIAGALVLVGLVGLFTSYYTVAPEEEAVVLRFGRYSKTTSPGLHFKLPFGVDRAIKVPVTEVRKEEFGFRTVEAGVRSSFSRSDSEAIMLTGDLNIAEVEWVVQYQIKDAKDFVFHVLDQEQTIRDLSESVMRTIVGDYTVTEVLTRKRDEIAVKARDDLQRRLDEYRMGVRIVTLKLQNANPPVSVRDSFNDVNAAQQERNQLVNEAEREYNKVIELAEGQAKRQISQAEGYAVERTNEAKGDVARFNELLDIYKRSSEVTRRRLYLETLEEVLPKVQRVMVVDSDGVLQHLPLAGGAR